MTSIKRPYSIALLAALALSLGGCDLSYSYNKTGNTQTTIQQAKAFAHQKEDAKEHEQKPEAAPNPPATAPQEEVPAAKKPQANDAAADEAVTLKIANDGGLPPFSSVAADGQLQGFDIDIGMALCRQMAVKCEFVLQSWDGMLPGLISGKFDAVLASMSVTADRQKVVDFTDKYYASQLVFIGAAGSHLQDLADKRIGAQQATTAAIYLQKNHPKASITTVATQAEGYALLQAGKLDLLLSDQLPAYNWLGSEAGSAFAVIGEGVPAGEYQDIAIAVRKNDPLKAQFNTALAAILASGQYRQISQKYFTFDIYDPKADHKTPLPAAQSK